MISGPGSVTGGGGKDGGLDSLTEALGIVRSASEAGIPLRLVGGLAVRVLCPDFPPREREAQDLDFASVSTAVRPLVAFLTDLGYLPDRTFNALYGRKQLFFAHDKTGRALDVMVDRLEMCHTIEFKDRIERMPYTLDVLDILLSKLQIIELNDKDVQDVVYLLSAYPINESGDSGAIDVQAFRRLVGSDWGWWRTVTMNLDRIESLVNGEYSHFVPEAPQLDPVEQLKTLGRVAYEAPKSLRWKARSRVGDKVRWYQIPEETQHY